MPAQLRKNYIGIVSDEIEERRAVEALARPRHRVKDFLLGLMTAVLKRQDQPTG